MQGLVKPSGWHVASLSNEKPLWGVSSRFTWLAVSCWLHASLMSRDIVRHDEHGAWPAYSLVHISWLRVVQTVQALASLKCLPDCPSKQSLELMVDYVLDRLY